MSNVGEILVWVGYTAASFVFYSITPFVLKLSGATLLNLSLLTSDMWAVVIRIFFYQQEVDYLYYLAFLLVVIGLVIYLITAKDNDSTPVLENETQNAHYQRLSDENAVSTDVL